MPPKENQRIALTRRLLQEGLLRLLEHEQLEDISVTALCKESGINRATFYNHYSSPSQLLAEMEAALVLRLRQLNPPIKTMEDILSHTEASCAYLKEQKALFHILVKYHIDRDLENVVGAIVRHYAAIRADFENIAMDHDTMRLVSSYLFAGCYALLREWMLGDIDKTPREIAELMVRIVSKEYL